MIKSNTKATAADGTSSIARVNVVFIRKSGQSQNEAPQINNVKTMLGEASLQIPQDDNWFVETVTRSNVRESPEFKRLWELVEANKIGVIYIESQDRWGTSTRPEYFYLIGVLRKHGTKLYDLRAKKDLTEEDFITELQGMFGSFKSEKELQDISYRSLRTRVNNFKASGSWPTGAQPFGYGKACKSEDGTLLWVWQPTGRLVGQVFHWDSAKEMLVPGPANVKIPRKAKGQLTILVPSNKPEFIESVRLIYSLYTKLGLSRRQISKRLNDEGRRHYNHEFTHPLVTEILKNPAYVGDTHFGKTRTGKHHSFDGSGNVAAEKVKGVRSVRKRAVEDRLVKRKTHDPLIDCETWDLAQAKLKAERERTSFSPRNPAYYLKQLLVCGHCGKGLSGRTEAGKVVYVCSSYMSGRSNGTKSSCGYHRVTHEEAERLLFDKIATLDLKHDITGSDDARSNLKRRFKKLKGEDRESSRQVRKLFEDGVNAFAGYVTHNYGVNWPEIQILRRRAAHFYWGEGSNEIDIKPGSALAKRLPAGLADIRALILSVEKKVLDHAQRELDELNAEHEKFTIAWAKATEKQQPILKAHVDKLDAEIDHWSLRAKPVTERLHELYSAEAQRRAEREKLRAEWPSLETREKGEAFRRLFNKVTLYWDPTFHPASENPTRPRKTGRTGRFSYSLDRAKFDIAIPDLGGSS